MHGKISRDGLMPLQKSTNGGSNSHRYKKLSVWSSSLPSRKFAGYTHVPVSTKIVGVEIKVALELGYRASE